VLKMAMAIAWPEDLPIRDASQWERADLPLGQQACRAPSVALREAFPLWMAFVNGVGLILGGLWMRRI